MGRWDKCTFTNFVILDKNEEPKLLSELSSEQKEKVQIKFSENLSRNLTAYFKQHPEVYEECVKKGILKDIEDLSSEDRDYVERVRKGLT